MPNTLITTSWVVNEAGEGFHNSLEFFGNIDRTYDKQFRTHDGAKVGNTIQARLPNIFTVSDGQAWQPQGITQRTTPVTLTYQSHVGLEWSTIQETTELQRVREQIIQPAADALASKVDSRAMADCYASVYNNVGTPGTTPTANTTWMTGASKIFDQAGSSKDLCAVLDVVSQIALVNANFTLFHRGEQISEQYQTGRFADNALGIARWYTDQNIPKHTTGAAGSGTPIVDNAGQTGSTITSTGWGSNTSNLLKGDVVEFAGVYSVNPLSKVSTGRLAQFVLTANCSDSTGSMSLLISPPIITSGQLQNVSAAPAANAAIYVWNTRSTTYAITAAVSPQNLIFRKGAFAGVMADLADPVAGAKASFANSEDLNISIRLIQQYLLQPDQNGTRLDCIYGAAPVQPRLAARVAA